MVNVARGQHFSHPKHGSIPVFFPDFDTIQIIDPYPFKSYVKNVQSPQHGPLVGDQFDYEGPSTSTITGVSFSASDRLEGFTIHYDSGRTVAAGSSASDMTFVGFLEGEHIVRLSGYVGSAVHSLVLETNHRIINCGEARKGERFIYEVPQGRRVAGIFGSHDTKNVYSIGVRHGPIPKGNSESRLQRRQSSSNVTLSALSPQLLLIDSLKKAWSNNDQKTIQAAQANASADLSPIYTNVVTNSANLSAWALAQDSSGEEFYISVGNPLPNDTAAALWVYPQQLSNTTNGNNTKLAVHAQYGSYSPSSGFGGVSAHIVEQLDGTIAAITVAAGLIKWLAQYYKTLSQSGSVAAEEVTVEAQSTEVEETLGEEIGEEVTVDAAASAAAFPVGTVAVCIVLALVFLFEWFYTTYTLSVNVYNYDTKNNWTISDYYGYNSLVSGGTWTPQNLSAVANSIPGPFGPQPTLDNVGQYVTYWFTNDQKIEEGLDIVLQVQQGSSSSGIGFMLGYKLNAVEDNQIALEAVVLNPETWYNNASWSTSTFASVTAGGLTISATTPALGGVSGHNYTFGVTIGSPS